MKDIRRKIGIILLCIGILILALIGSSFIGQKVFELRYFKSLPNFSISSYEKSPYCAICTTVQSNAPLLVNINTGSAEPMRIYPTHTYYANQIREDDSYGIFFMIGGDGWNGGSDPDFNYSDISIQRKAMYKPNLDAAALYFCEDCLQAIQSVEPTSNFVTLLLWMPMTKTICLSITCRRLSVKKVLKLDTTPLLLKAKTHTSTLSSFNPPIMMEENSLITSIKIKTTLFRIETKHSVQAIIMICHLNPLLHILPSQNNTSITYSAVYY